MTDHTQILRDRLAKGEITEAEYDRLAKKIAGTTPAAAPKKTFNWLWFGIVIAAAVVGFQALKSNSGASDGLNTASVTGVPGEALRFVLTNTSKRTGDVVFWISVNGANSCHMIKRLEAEKRYEVRTRCTTVPSGGTTFSLLTGWADKVPDEASLAIRIE